MHNRLAPKKQMFWRKLAAKSGKKILSGDGILKNGQNVLI